MWEERIVVNSRILVGKPVVRGARLAVEFIGGLLAQGWTESDILNSYPGLESADIRACLAYAAVVLQLGSWPSTTVYGGLTPSAATAA